MKDSAELIAEMKRIIEKRDQDAVEAEKDLARRKEQFPHDAFVGATYWHKMRDIEAELLQSIRKLSNS